MEIRFKLNPKNKKDQEIIELLNKEYSPADTIKNMLYKTATMGENGIEMDKSGRNTSNSQSDTEKKPPVSDENGEQTDSCREFSNEFDEYFN